VKMPTNEVQERRLHRLAQDTAQWGVLIYVERPGDVPCVVPVHPDLAGYEFVAVTSDTTYDIWRDGHLNKPDATLIEIGELLATHPVGDDDPVVEWTEATLQRLGCRKVN